MVPVTNIRYGGDDGDDDDDMVREDFHRLLGDGREDWEGGEYWLEDAIHIILHKKI